MASARARAWQIAALLAVVLAVAALEARLPEMTRPVWQDEVHHNEPILDSPTMHELDQSGMYRSMMQPKLDFWLRKVFWFPAFGVSERTIRLPALVFGVASVLVVYLVLLLLLLRARVEPRWCAVVAFAAALWVVHNPTEVFYSAEGRHYAMVAFASTAWFAVLLLFDGKPRWLLAATALLFANSHFFALPLIAAGYGLQVLRELRAKKYGWILFHLASGVVICETLVQLSWSSFGPLMTDPPGGRHAAPLALFAMFDAASVEAGLKVWLRFSDVLAVPPATWLVWLVMLGDVIVARRGKWLPTVLTAWLLCPLLFIYMQYRSSYPWGDRYFTPFFGLGLVTLAAAIDLALRAWRRWSPRRSDRARKRAAVAGLIAAALLLGVPRAIYELAAGVTHLRRVPANFSPWYLAYREIWEEKKPVLVLHQWLYTTDIQRFYFRYVLPPNGITYRQFDLLGYDIDLVLLKKSGIPWFLTDFASRGAFVVLDEKEKDCGTRPAPPAPPPLHIERVRATTRCMWKVRNARSLAELALAADLVGFGGAARLH